MRGSHEFDGRLSNCIYQFVWSSPPKSVIQITYAPKILTFQFTTFSAFEREFEVLFGVDGASMEHSNSTFCSIQIDVSQAV